MIISYASDIVQLDQDIDEKFFERNPLTREEVKDLVWDVVESSWWLDRNLSDIELKVVFLNRFAGKGGWQHGVWLSQYAAKCRAVPVGQFDYRFILTFARAGMYRRAVLHELAHVVEHLLFGKMQHEPPFLAILFELEQQFGYKKAVSEYVRLAENYAIPLLSIDTCLELVGE